MAVAKDSTENDAEWRRVAIVSKKEKGSEKERRRKRMQRVDYGSLQTVSNGAPRAAEREFIRWYIDFAS